VNASPDGNFILEADWVLAVQNDRPKLLRNASVRVRADRIEQVSEAPIKCSAPRIRARGQIVLPGLISAHTHISGGTPTRGVIEEGRSFMRPFALATALDDEATDDLTAYNLAELLRSGCTTQLDMSLSPSHVKSYVRVARRWGVRAYPGNAIPGFDRLGDIWAKGDDALLRSTDETLAEIESYRRFAIAINGADDGRILPMIAPHGPDTNTVETLEASLAVARELGNGIQIHLCRLTEEVDTVQRLWGCGPIQLLQRVGFFSEPLFGAHLSCIDLDTDLPILLDHDKFTYVHCPSGGGAGATNGCQPFPELVAAGVNTALGTDTHSNDYVENLKLAVLNGRARCFLRQHDSDVPMRLPTIWDAIEAGTLNAARGLGREDLGRIAPGAKADICSIDVTGFLVGGGAVPPEPLNNLLYANGLSVQHVVTDGNFQVMDGVFQVDDARRIQRRGGEVLSLLWEQLAAEGWFRESPAFPPGWPFSFSAAPGGTAT
jgi:cytosine/adenosine deaminase-related metal-dependent hydrolase